MKTGRIVSIVGFVVSLMVWCSVSSAVINTSTLFLEDWENLNDGDGPGLNGWLISGGPAVAAGNIGGPAGDSKILNANGTTYRDDLSVTTTNNTFTVEYDVRIDMAESEFFSNPYVYGQGGWQVVWYKLAGEGPVHGDYLKLQSNSDGDPGNYWDVADLPNHTDLHFVDVFTVGTNVHNLTITDSSSVVYQGNLAGLAAFGSAAFTRVEIGTMAAQAIQYSSIISLSLPSP